MTDAPHAVLGSWPVAGAVCAQMGYPIAHSSCQVTTRDYEKSNIQN